MLCQKVVNILPKITFFCYTYFIKKDREKDSENMFGYFSTLKLQQTKKEKSNSFLNIFVFPVTFTIIGLILVVIDSIY